MDTVYTDFSKAFDRVNHNLLVAKIEAFGVGGTLLSWFRSFLTGRTQVVRYRNYCSRLIIVSSGVPQGSHLGPLLFNIFVNDVKKCLCGSFLMFADDLKLYSTIKDSNSVDLLQVELNSLYEWSLSNFLPLNLDKCHIITFSRSKTVCEQDYFINGRRLVRFHSIRDLGVILDERLSFKEHIATIKSRPV